MRKKILWSILAVIGLLFVGFSVYISIQVADGTTHLVEREDTYENSLTYLKEHDFDLDQFKKEHKMIFSKITSSAFGHKIPLLEIKTSAPSNGAVIMVHGLGGSKESILPISQMFLDLGYDVYAYDQRNSGENMAETNTFGVLESKDLEDVTHRVAKSLDSNQTLILWGESFGGATVGLGAKNLSKEVDYLILDSPVADGEAMTRQELNSISEETGLPLDYMLTLGDWNLRISQGFSLADSKVTEQIKEVPTPLLIVHSKTDEVVPYTMGQEVFQASPAKHKKFISVNQGEHASLFYEQTDLYRQSIEQFLNQTSD
ncbi:alpha/beta hydrolase [Ignavigranum ruoffiae]|uniref:alpha/beta hydrolase n=1 Tax=Ignavigranum ruoffiae TaxID=89093 RepID=UPI003B009986